MLQRYVLLMPLFLMAVQGCRPGGPEDVATLQQQVALLASQVEETRKEMDTLRQTNQELGKLLDTLQTEVSSLLKEEKIIPSPGALAGREVEAPEDEEEFVAPDVELPTPKPPVRTATPAEPTEPALKSTAPVSCTRVWGLLGRGRSETSVARTLKITVEEVRACEQGVGRGGRR
ncbi:MAG: hypothetical protein ACRERD_23565 [Candidatus Binatia bacterium]